MSDELEQEDKAAVPEPEQPEQSQPNQQAEVPAPQEEQPQAEPPQEVEPPEDERNPVERKLAELGLDPDAKKDEPAKTPEPPKQEPPKALTPEQEEQALIAGVTSKRGRERLTKLLGERKESVAQVQAFNNVIQRSGLDREGFANVLEISRLCSSADPEEQERGLKALEAVRSELYRSLGKEAPGIDLLQDYADLQKKVTEFGMDRKDALEIARARQLEAQQRQQASTQRLLVQQKQMLDGFGQQCMAAFRARQNDVDFEAKVQALQDYFSKPGAIQNFVSTHSPETFTQGLLWLYDNCGGASIRPASTQPTPITQNRVRSMGRPAPVAAASPDGIEARMKQLGL